MTDLKTFLHGLPAFERFSDRPIDLLINKLHVETYEPNAVLLRQHEQGSALHIIMSGVVQVNLRESGSNEDINLLEAHIGEMVGHLSLIPNTPSPVTCVTVGQVTTASLTPEHYNALFLLAPSVANQIQYMLATQLAFYLQLQNQGLSHRLIDRTPPPAPPSLLERLFSSKKSGNVDRT